ncbi:MAG: hypothetical protein U0354_18670 [Candidatus Sericytochromatia bacterium]
MKKTLCILISTLVLVGCSTSTNITGNTDTKILISDKLKNLNPAQERLVFLSVTNNGSSTKADFFMLNNKGEDKKPLLKSDVLLNEISSINSSFIFQAFSPDFSKLMYITKNSSGKNDVIVSNSDGSSRIKIIQDINEATDIESISWSFDSKKISFSLKTTQDESTFFTFDLEKKEVKKFSVKSNQEKNLNIAEIDKEIETKSIFSLSPDGTKISYIKYKYSRSRNNEAGKPVKYSNSEAYLTTIKTDGTDEKTLKLDFTNDDYDVSKTITSWSPDGTKIIFSINSKSEKSNFKTMIVNSDLTGLKELSSSGNISLISNVWSLDASKVVLYDSQSIYTINSDGSNKNKIMDLKSSSPMLPIYLSPDGKKVLVSESVSQSNATTYTFNSDGTGDKIVSSGTNAAIGWASSVKEISEIKLSDIDESIVIKNPINIAQNSSSNDSRLTELIKLFECAAGKSTAEKPFATIVSSLRAIPANIDQTVLNSSLISYSPYITEAQKLGCDPNNPKPISNPDTTGTTTGISRHSEVKNSTSMFLIGYLDSFITKPYKTVDGVWYDEFSIRFPNGISERSLKEDINSFEFGIFDTDNNKEITKEEYRKAFFTKSNDSIRSNFQIRLRNLTSFIFSKIDKNKDKVLNFDEIHFSSSGSTFSSDFLSKDKVGAGKYSSLIFNRYISELLPKESFYID